MKSQPGMYIGIDLGTTNTVVAQVTVDLQGQFMPPVCLSIDQQVDEYGNREHRQKLPSAVHVSPNGPLIPGIYAHQRMVLGQGSSDVISWWKNDIGRLDEASTRPSEAKKWRMNGQVLTPVDAAAAVLVHLREQLERQYPNALTRPVVTVPASFPESMKAATRDAIRQAGWIQANEESLLLYEPIAALMAYLARYEREQLPLPPAQRSPNWEEGGRVIVYDIGGGTVDVTLVGLEPCQDPVTNELRLRASVEDYAPHTLLGGFKFDEAFAEALVAKFCHEHQLTKEQLPKSFYNFLFFAFRSKAEHAKMQLANGQSPFRHNFGIYPEPLLNLPQSIWPCEFTYDEYVAAVAPLLGKDATASSELPSLQWRFIGEADHIMEPVIRLLQAQQLLPSDISALLLVGGMSYLPAVRKRLSDFFGEQTALLWNQVDPLQAIAYGAALHNAQLANGRSLHHVLLRPASLRVYSKQLKRVLWQDLIPRGTSLAYGERFEYTKDELAFPAGQREVLLQVRYGGVVRRGLRFQLPEELPLGSTIPFACQIAVDSHSHILALQAHLLDHPDVTIQSTFDESPERNIPSDDPTPTTVKHNDPEEKREKKDIPSLVRQMGRAFNAQIAAERRKELERAAHLGAYVKKVAQVLDIGTHDGQQHACILLSRIFERYTSGDTLNPRTPTEVARALQAQQPILVTRLQELMKSRFRPAMLRTQAAYALGWVGLWEPDKINMQLLLTMIQNYNKGLQVEAARAIGRTVTTQRDWQMLIRSWRPKTLPVGAREAVLWGISRAITRHTEFVLHADPTLLANFLKRLLSNGISDGNIPVQMTAWGTIALLSLTSDLELTQPVYAAQYPSLLAEVQRQAEAEQERIVIGQQGARQAAMQVLQALSGKPIISKMRHTLEPSIWPEVE